MAQRDTKSTKKEVASTRERPSPVKLRTSVSHPTSSNLANEQPSNPRRHLTLPVLLNSTYPQSAAESYISSRTQILTKPNEQQDISPETPSSNTSITINPFQFPISHAERMHNWHQEQAKKICKKQKHRYSYGTPSPPSLGFACFSPSSQLNLPLSSRSSIPQTCTIKKDTLIEQSKTNESRHKIKLSAV